MAHLYHRLSALSLAAFSRQAHTLFCFLILLLLLLGPGSWSIRGADALTGTRPETQSQSAFLEDHDTESAAIQEVIALKPGESIRRQMKGGERQLFKVSLLSGQYLSIVVEQRGIELIVKLSGKRTIEMDNPSGAHGPVYVSMIAYAGGDLTIEVRSTEGWANAGEYEIKIEELRDATPADQGRIAAEEEFAKGRGLFREDKEKSYQAAITEYEKALSYWERAQDRHWKALTLYSLGVAHRKLGELKTAEKRFNESLAIQLEAHDWRLRASALNDRGYNYAMLGERQKALESLNAALKVYQDHQDRRGQASALNNIGLTYAIAGEMRRAIEFYQKALPLRRAENDQAGEFNLLNNMGGFYDRLGEPYKALEYYGKALQGWQELDSRGRLNDREQLGIGFNNVAVANDKLGEWQKALEYYEKALAIFQQTGSGIGQAATLDNIGELYVVLGDPTKAMEYYDKARSLLQKGVNDPNLEANVLTHIGQVYISQGKASGALGYFGAALKLKPGVPRQANIQTNIGAVYASQGNPKKALEAYDDALTLWRSSGDRRGQAITLHKEGEAYALLGDQMKALENFSQALALWKALADQRGEAATLQGIARIERERDNLTEALKLSEEAINISESLRTKVTSQQLRTSYFATQQDYYELYIDLQMKSYHLDHSSQHLAEGLQASERSRARSLIDTLLEAQADITQGVSEELLKQEREVQQKLNAKAQVQMRLLNGKHTDEQAANIAQEIDELITDYDNLRARIRASSPKYAHLTQPRPMSLQEIQQLLDNDTLLLEYSLGEERSYLWLVSHSSITGSNLLPKRSDVEKAARRFYELLAAPQPLPGESPAERQKRLALAATEYQSLATTLSEMLLGPVADQLGKKRLVIVGDGVLQYLPFDALPVPASKGEGNLRAHGEKAIQAFVAPYLVEEHEIVSLPSASALAVLRNELEGRRKRAPLTVAVLADPVFDLNDSRFDAARKRRAFPVGKTTQSNDSIQSISVNRMRSGLDLQPLPATRKEAQAIKDAMSPGQTMLALDFEASRSTVVKLQEGRYPVIHFATHGIFNAEHPELSGIVLSLLDAEGRPQDGFLRLHDIYNLKLPSEMIVLSACSTGLGSVIKGEGLVGLTRGFMYAGSPRVIASLWRVDDLATAVLMGRFYRHVTTGRLSPAAALRQSQIEMLKGKRWQSPYYWAGFVLQGEWKEIR